MRQPKALSDTLRKQCCVMGGCGSIDLLLRLEVRFGRALQFLHVHSSSRHPWGIFVPLTGANHSVRIQESVRHVSKVKAPVLKALVAFGFIPFKIPSRSL